MGGTTDYYSILELERTAGEADVKGAYRRLALKHHPERKGADGGVNPYGDEERFREIAEAYTVLSDGEKKARFDMYGEEGLKQGRLDATGYRGWQYVGDPQSLFFEFFGTYSPIAAAISAAEHELNVKPRTVGSGADGAGALDVQLRCSLEELYTGATKSVRVERQRFSAGAGPEDKGYVDATTIHVKLDPKWKAGMRLCYPREGHQVHPTGTSNAVGPSGSPDVAGAAPDSFCPAGDLFLTIVEEAHSNFERVGDADAAYVHKVSLADALCGHTIEGLRLLDGTCMNLAVPESVTPGYEKRVKNHGFAKANGGGFGDMLVRFDIQFPAPGKLSGGLNVEKRKELRKLLE